MLVGRSVSGSHLLLALIAQPVGVAVGVEETGTSVFVLPQSLASSHSSAIYVWALLLVRTR